MSSKPLTISRKRARALALTAGGLHRKDPYGVGQVGALNMIRDIGYVQIDTISVVLRAHHHILASRNSSYKKSHLSNLQKQGDVFEYWAHAASYLPMPDFRFTHHTKSFFRSGKDNWPRPEPKVMARVLEQVTKEGPMMARDFESAKPVKGQGWWDWKPAKRALERLFLEGKLMIRERKGFQKVYDLTERVVPNGVNTTTPTLDEYADYLIDKGIRSYGLVSESEMAYLRRGMRKVIASRARERLHAGEVVRIRVKGLDDQEYFCLPEAIDQSYRVSKKLRLLSPFDHVTIQRQRLSSLFDFDYQIECYVPKAKRKYGYFCLPVQYGDQFVARADIKADRQSSTLKVQRLTLEPGHKVPVEKWGPALTSFARLNDCEEIWIGEVTDGSVRDYLTTQFHS